MSEKPVVLLGISGSIAAYKACELVRRLMDVGADVHCVMTENACRFVTPLTFQALSRNQVHADLFGPASSWDAEHVSLADMASLAVVCPASANIIGKMAAGIADDLLSTVLMAAASRVKVLVCPAMNHHMFANPVVQENIRKLRGLGYLFVDPEEGTLASGARGQGRLARIEVILEKIKPLLA